ncbi:MAG: hypothetical protein J7K81_02865 [Methanophagales archaeon]|nr:hypothetical protein [Methanophagales archaeon]
MTNVEIKAIKEAHQQYPEFLSRWDTRDYSAGAMINFHLFIALCRFDVRDGLLFLSNNPARCRAIGFVNGVPREATVSRFRARMGCDFDGAFADLVKYVVEMTEVEKVNRKNVFHAPNKPIHPCRDDSRG